MPSDWQIQLEGKTYGPFDDARLKALVEQGRVTPETLVRRQSQGRWVAAKLVKGLFAKKSPGESDSPRKAAASGAAKPPPRRGSVAAPPARVARAPAYPQPISGQEQGVEATSVDVVAGPLIRPDKSTRRPARQSGDSTLNVMLGAAGAGALLLGFFCPIIRLPIIGSMSYLNILGLQLKNGDVNELTIAAFLTLLAMLGGAVVAVIKRRQLFWLPGAAGATASLLTVAIFIRIQMDMSRDMDRDLKDNPFRGLAEALAQSVSLDFGIGVIVIGTALLIAAAVVPEKKR